MSRSLSSSAESTVAHTSHRLTETPELALLQGLEELHVKAKDPKLILVAMFIEAAIEELRDGLPRNGTRAKSGPPRLRLPAKQRANGSRTGNGIGLTKASEAI